MDKDTRTHAPSWLEELTESIISLASRNSVLLTGFAAVFILFTGYTLAETPDRWYVPLIILSIALVIFLVFVEARSVFKVVGAALITVFASVVSFMISLPADPYSNAPALWFLSYWIVFFASIAVSYLVVRGKSRWGALILAEFAALAGGYVSLFGSLSVLVAAITSTVVGLGVFLLSYNLNRRSRYRSGRMPINVTIDTITDSLLGGTDKLDWFGKAFVNSKKETGHYLVWDDRAYLLVPVVMNEAFSVIGNRWTTGLGYAGEAINPWLVDMIYNRTPFWMSKSAPIMVVLLDMRNANGKKPRTIAVSLPDTKKRAAVGILPAKSLLNGPDDAAKLLQKIDREFSDHTYTLTTKNLKSLGELAGTRDTSEYRD